MRISDWSSDVCSSDLIAATAHDLGLAAWVRIPEREYGVIGRVLDSGATGIIAPKIETEAEARLLAAACRFPPVGQRSMIAKIPQTGFVRSPVNEFVTAANQKVVVQEIGRADVCTPVNNAQLVSRFPLEKKNIYNN